jgi:LCP family protein required for cell wall assembly
MPRHATNHGRFGWRWSVGLSLLGLLSFVVAGALFAYSDVQRGIDRVDVSDLVAQPSQGEPDPVDLGAGKSITLLAIGTDSRQGANAELVPDGTDSVLSDTAIVINISADRDRIDMVSIPRDSLVEIPECTTTGGDVLPARYGMFNSAFAEGWHAGGDYASAVACTMSTTQHNTGLVLDGFVLVDFAGFTTMVDALGGVPMCITSEMNAPEAGLHLEPGEHVLDGKDALGYARARKGLDDGSDTARIVRQQQLLAAMASEVLSRNLLTDAPELYRFTTAATRTLTTSPELGSVPFLTGLAFSLRDVAPGAITLMTVPSAPAPEDHNRLVWTDEAHEVWDSIADDVPVTPEPAPNLPTSEATSPRPTASSSSPHDGKPTSGPITAADAPATCS